MEDLMALARTGVVEPYYGTPQARRKSQAPAVRCSGKGCRTMLSSANSGKTFTVRGKPRRLCFSCQKRYRVS